MAFSWLLACARGPQPTGASLLEIITGRGLGREGGVPVVKPAVQQLLQEVEVPFLEEEGNPARREVLKIAISLRFRQFPPMK